MKSIQWILIFTSYLIISKPTIAQDSLKITQLHQLLQTATSDTTRVQTFYQLGDAYRNHPVNEERYIQKGLKLAQAISFHQGIATGWIELGALKFRKQQNEQALEYYEKAKQVAIQQRLPALQAQSLNEMARIYSRKNRFIKALKTHQSAIKMAQFSKSSRQITLTLFYTGEFYRNRKNYPRSLAYFNDAEDNAKKGGLMKLQRKILAFKSMVFADQHLYKKMEASDLKGLKIAKKTGDSLEIACAYNNLAGTYSVLKQSKKAILFYKKALQINAAKKCIRLMHALCHNLGSLYKEAPKKALVYYKKALQYCNNETTKGITLRAIGQVLYQQKKYAQANAQFKQSIALLQKSGILDELMKSYEQMAKCYAATQQFKLAFQYHQLYKSSHDSIFNLRKGRQIVALEQQLKDEERASAIALLKKETHLQKQRIAHQQLRHRIMLVGLILILLIVALLYSRYRLRHRIIRQQSNLLQQENARYIEESRRLDAERRLKQEENKRLLNNLDYKNRELATTTLLVQQKNEVLQNIHTGLVAFENQIPQKWSKSIYRIQKIIQENTNLEEDWERLQLHFNEVHPAFFHKLQNSFCNLSQNDLRLCAYIKINLSNKEIARLLNVEFRSIQMAKYRLKKKLGLSKEDDLNELVQQL
ncbi:hypothetical protein BKI52_42985 [marine bacterium AO1-C]|nr:hypothetical protein BKI52_42985 [marine bacterium AO1-C]